MSDLDLADVPFGTEVFIIVPDDVAPLVDMSRSRLRASLAQKFPQFDFSLGRGVSGHGDDWGIMTVAGTVGDGWQKARPVKFLSREDHQAILDHLKGFVSGEVGRPN